MRLSDKNAMTSQKGEGEPVDPAKLEATGNFTHAEAKVRTVLAFVLNPAH